MKPKFNVGRIVDVLPVLFLSIISALAISHYFPDGSNLPYADAISRLNIARKVIDNLTPGIAQIGSVWLPLPQILMLPFIWNDYMWRSGLAGTIMSTASFIIGGFYVFKSARLISNSIIASFMSLGIYALNINMWYLETTAMSECLFVAMLAMCIYYFLKWFKTDNWFFLAPAGVAISAITLTRYEGLPLLLGAIPMVFVFSLIRSRKTARIEGQLLVFSFAACFGFALWTLYLFLIFGDPLFWMKYYASAQITEQVGNTVVEKYSQAKPFTAAVWQYFTSVTWMTGIVATALAIISIPLMLFDSIRKKNWYFLPLLLPLSIFLMMVLTLQRNTPIVQPDLTIENILRSDTSMDTGFNIRYGLMIHSWLAILTVYIFKIPGLNLIAFAFFFIQVVSYFAPNYTFIYKIPMGIKPKPYGEMVDWLKKNYRGGPIFVSASGFEDQMFEIGFPYRYYIHEGTNKYWKEALDHPARYASYVIVDFNHPADRLGKELKHKQYWSWFYNLVYTSDKGRIYEVKTKPEIVIKAVPTFNPRPKEPSPYVSQEGQGLILNGKPFEFVGKDLRDIVYKEEAEIVEELEIAKSEGVNVVRVWAYGEGEKDGFMPESYKYNDTAFQKLAFVVSEVAIRNMFVIITLGNYDNEHGGVFQYLRWDGLPTDTPEAKDAFFTNQFTRNRYREYISRVVAYKNPYTNIQLREDPAVFAWELLFNPQISSPEKTPILNEWFTQMRSVVAHFDKHHIILTGEEGIDEEYWSMPAE